MSFLSKGEIKMLVSEFLNDDRFELVTDTINDKLIKGAYCGDLLSWVMSHAKKGDLWCTVLTHANVVAIATLLEVSCVIICESAPIESETINKANQEKVNLIKTKLNSVEVIKKLWVENG